MATQCQPPEGTTGRKDVMESVVAGLEECGFPALAAEEWEIGGIADKPDFANEVRTIQNVPAVQALSLRDSGHSVFGDHSGQSVTTSRFVNREMTVEEAIQELDERGMIEGALNEIFQITRDKAKSLDILQYTLWLFAKGWVAERALASGDRFKKVAESQDIGGQDFYDSDRDEYIQLKAVSHGFRAYQDSGGRGNHSVDGTTVAYYQFDESGNVVVDYDHTTANGEAADTAGVKKTAMWKSLMWA